jgi:hypothetical protein
MASHSAAPDGFTITVPDSWFELDLLPATRDANINSLVYEQVRGPDELVAVRPQIVSLLRDFAEYAWESGATYCACFVTPTTEGPITGSVTVSVIDAPAGASDAPPIDRALTHLQQVPVPRTAGTSRCVTTATIEGLGLVARTYGIEDVTLPNGSVVTSVTMQTFVPLPPSNRLLLVSASSPVLWLEEELLELFDAVANTVRLIHA